MSEPLLVVFIFCFSCLVFAFAFKGFMIYLNELDEKHSKRRRIEREAEYAYASLSAGGVVTRRIEKLEERVSNLHKTMIEIIDQDKKRGSP